MHTKVTHATRNHIQNINYLGIYIMSSTKGWTSTSSTNEYLGQHSLNHRSRLNTWPPDSHLKFCFFVFF